MTANITDVSCYSEHPKRPGLSRQQQERKAVNNLLHELARACEFLPHKTLLAALQVASLLSLPANSPWPGQSAGYARLLASTPLSVDESELHQQMKLQTKINAIEQERSRVQQQYDIAYTTSTIDPGNTTAKAQMSSAKNKLDSLERQLKQLKFNK